MFPSLSSLSVTRFFVPAAANMAIWGNKWVQDALHESQEQLRQMAENLQEVFWLTDSTANKMLYVSPAYERVWGRTCESLYQQPRSWLGAIHPEDLGRVYAAFEGFLRGGIFNEEFRVVRPDGSNRWVWDRAFPVTDSEGNIYRIVGSAQDITDRKQAEEALRVSEERYRSLIQGAAYGICRTSLEGRFLDVNPALVQMLGYGCEAQLLEADIATDVYSDSAESARVIEQIQKQDRIDGVETQWKRKDGTPITVRVSGRAVRHAQGAVACFEAIVENVTERRALEDQLRQAQKMEAIALLAGGIAHDFNNLLTGILGYGELLQGAFSPTDDRRRKAEEIVRAALQGRSLTHQLLVFSRKQVLQLGVVDLNGVIDETDHMLRRLIGEDIELLTLLAPDLGNIKSDPGRLTQVIINLALNSRDAMPRGGKLTIQTANVDLVESDTRRLPGLEPGRYIVLTLSDTGCGMDAATQARIFEPFFTTKPLGKGTGLGLSTVYGIIQQSDAHITVSSTPGQGTTFKVYFPRVQEALAVAKPRRGQRQLRSGSETILVVEDNDVARELTCEFLETAGYTALKARSGAEAVRASDQHEGPIHLLLTDVVMPGMSGPELVGCLAALRNGMKVLYMTGYPDQNIPSHGVSEPGITLLQKPFSQGELLNKVNEVLNAPKAHLLNWGRAREGLKRHKFR